jgi:dihydropyrimidine dehydrogenase (NAD+) subunit PreA
VARAFDAGWGGAVWKTIGEPIVNVTSRYSAVHYADKKVMGLNNIELITDRPIEVNLREIADVKKRYPNHALIVSLMVESNREAWHEIVKRTEDTGCDGLELNFGCPHGMSERGMGSAVGQVPDYTCMIVEWVKEVATTPVIVKLTPNITDIRYIARASARGGADAISLINTLNSITGIDLNTLEPRPAVRGKSSHGGYCGPAVKPIALNMVNQIASDPEMAAIMQSANGKRNGSLGRIPISGIGGVQSWQDAVEFMLLGATNVQVCTAVMHYGVRLVEGMIDGLSNWMEEKGFQTPADFMVKPSIDDGGLGPSRLNYKAHAQIHEEKCIHCGLCYIACEDGCHQSIRIQPHNGVNHYSIKEESCVGCNMCMIVCPVEGCITMDEIETGKPEMSWNTYQQWLTEGKVEKILPPEHV